MQSSLWVTAASTESSTGSNSNDDSGESIESESPDEEITRKRSRDEDSNDSDDDNGKIFLLQEIYATKGWFGTKIMKRSWNFWNESFLSHDFPKKSILKNTKERAFLVFTSNCFINNCIFVSFSHVCTFSLILEIERCDFYLLMFFFKIMKVGYEQLICVIWPCTL